MRSTSRVKLLLLRLLGTYLLAACNAAPAVPTTLPTVLPKNGQAAQASVTELQIFLPQDTGLATSNPMQELRNSLDQFNAANPTLHVTPVTISPTRSPAPDIQRAQQKGKASLGLLPSSFFYLLRDQDVILPVDECLSKMSGKTTQSDFFPAFLRDSQDGGRQYAIPFWRAILELFYNKDAFQAAGLDPEKPPQTWDTLAIYAQKLTQRDKSDTIERWGVENGVYLDFLHTLSLANGENLVSSDGTVAQFNTAATVDALQYWVDLVGKSKAMPGAVVPGIQTLNDFRTGKTVMMIQYSPLLIDVLKVAKFPVGVAALPAGKQSATPTPGLSFYFFKQSNPAAQDAACRLVQFLTSAEKLADWSIASGSVAVRKSAYSTPALQDYLAKNPLAAVARDQVQVASPSLAFHSSANQRILGTLNLAVQSALAGSKTPKEALTQAQTEADTLLAQGK